ncbi:MAG TPA: PAS domain-containing sensor histidine kinase [Sphingomonadaceae bacterium]
MYEEAPCGYISLSPDGHVVKVNRTLCNWLGLYGEGLIGRPFHKILSFGGRIAFETHLAPLLRLQGSVDEVALDVLHADGSKLPVLANAAEKRSASGEHLFTRLTLIKSVERRAYERNLQTSLATAEAAYTAEHDAAILREQFIAVLGHDLRNPLAAITAGIQMLRKHETLSERGKVVAREMSASVSRASALIDNVLDFARNRLGNGLAIERDSKAPLTPVLEQVIAEMRAVAPDHVIESRFSIDEPVSCDRVKIGQLASNLLANAVTHGAPDIPIVFSAATSPSHLTITVSNGGPRIDTKTQARLFQPFFRGDVRRSQNGLGLGLFIVSEIAKAHGGTIDVSSSEHETCFVFSMPIGEKP